MAKRGEKRPWKVRFAWSTGVSGVVSCSSESQAGLKADEIRRASEWRDDATVTVEITCEG